MPRTSRRSLTDAIHAVSASRVQLGCLGGRGGGVEAGEPVLEELVAGQLLVLAVALGVLVVGGGEQPRRRVVGGLPSRVRSWSTRLTSSARSSAGEGTA